MSFSSTIRSDRPEGLFFWSSSSESGSKPEKLTAKMGTLLTGGTTADSTGGSGLGVGDCIVSACSCLRHCMISMACGCERTSVPV